MPPPPFSVLPIIAVNSRRLPWSTPSTASEMSRWRKPKVTGGVIRR
jgi:hypothetical protein